jgi:hypothetical protein
MLFRLQRALNKLLEKHLLIVFKVQGIQKNNIDDYKFNELVKIAAEIQQNNIKLICSNIGIVLILVLFIYEVF